MWNTHVNYVLSYFQVFLSVKIYVKNIRSSVSFLLDLFLALLVLQVAQWP